MSNCKENKEEICKSYPLCYGCNSFEKPTNYDRIRNMSVEEMAVFLNYNISQDEYMNTVIRNLDNSNIKRTICFNSKDVREWLESEEE